MLKWKRKKETFRGISLLFDVFLSAFNSSPLRYGSVVFVSFKVREEYGLTGDVEVEGATRPKVEHKCIKSTYLSVFVRAKAMRS